MSLLRASILAFAAACWTSTAVPPELPRPARPPSTSGEHRATVRIDPEPGAKHFQGVWLEFSERRRWLIDYRARDIWRSFADRTVLVSGHCYEPFGQAIAATHFAVEHMRLVDRVPDVPLTEVGPELILRGALAVHAHPAGGKHGGSSEVVFRDGGGTTYWIHAADDQLPGPGPVAVTAREVHASPAFAALPDGPRLWIFDFHAADHAPDPAHAPRVVPCPGD
jgi:hypothetical protein